MDFFLEHFGAFLTAVVTGFSGWFFGRKQANANVESTQIENATKALEYYEKLVKDLGERLEEAIKRFKEAEKIIKELEEKVEGLTEELKKYKQLNGKAK